MIDLNYLSQQLDKTLEKETAEYLTEWLLNRRGKTMKDTMKSDVTTYSQKEYSEMEKSLADKINLLIKEIETKYNVQPLIDTIDSKTRVEVFILNKGMHHL